MDEVKATTDLGVVLKADGIIARARRRSEAELKRKYMRGSVMSDVVTWTGAAGAFLMKLAPPAIGAAIVIAVKPPKTTKELFLRVFVAFAFSWLFGRTTADFLQGFGWFKFIDYHNEEHRTAILGLLGASGWFVCGGGAQLLENFKNRPTETIEETKKAVS